MPESDLLGTGEGLTTIPSRFGPKETMDRLATEIQAKGMDVFARIDHAAGAAEVGMTLRPTELIIFGNARGGTPLMQSVQTVVNLKRCDFTLRQFGENLAAAALDELI